MPSALHTFIDAHRDQIVDACMERDDVGWPSGEQEHRAWIGSMLDELGAALEVPSDDFGLWRGITPIARQRGAVRKAGGTPVDVLVRDFAALCDAVCSVADEHDASLAASDAQGMNRFIDGAIAAALEPYGCKADQAEANTPDVSFVLAIGNAVAVARSAFAALQGGRVGINSRTGAVLDRSLARIEEIVANTVGDLLRTSKVAP